MTDTAIDQLFAGIEDEDVELDASKTPIDGGGYNKDVRIQGNRRLKKVKEVDTPEGEVVVQPSSTVRGEVSSDDEDQETAAADMNDPTHGGQAVFEEDDGQYWDEEDEIEQYLQRHGSSKEEEEEENGEEEEEELALVAGDGTTRGDMDAETQRLLREVATRDRLGRGQKIEIKPLTGIVEKLRKKKAEVHSRAVHLRAPEVPSFDDILADVEEAGDIQKAGHTIQKDHDEKPKNFEREVNNAADQETASHAAQGGYDSGQGEQPATPGGSKITSEDDLEVVKDEGEEHEGEFRLIEIPRKTPTKPSPLAFNPFNTQDADDFEDNEERLFDDGAGSEYDESDSDHSWEVRKEDVSNDDDDEKDDAVSSDCTSHDGMDGTKHDKEDGESNREESQNDKENENPVEQIMKDRDVLSKSIALKSNEVVKKLGFIDTEAELSDEEGGRGAVSDDEDEDDEDVDKNGELTDLIAEAKTTLRDQKVTEELHLQWARQKEAKELQQLLRGLQNGFGRRGNGMDDLPDEISGRQRRARYEDDDDLGLGTAWPSLFGNPTAVGNDGEEGEEEAAMLRQAQQRKLVESQTEQSPPDSIPLDEDSQNVLELFAKSSSEPQDVHFRRSRSKEIWNGSEPSNGHAPGPSFLGRQSSLLRHQSTSNMGIPTGRSYVFGRKESSHSRFPPDIEGSDVNSEKGGSSQGPVDFSNLHQLTNSQETTLSTTSLKRSGSTLLRKIPKCKRPANFQKAGTADVVGAVCNQVGQSHFK